MASQYNILVSLANTLRIDEDLVEHVQGNTWRVDDKKVFVFSTLSEAYDHIAYSFSHDIFSFTPEIIADVVGLPIDMMKKIFENRDKKAMDIIVSERDGYYGLMESINRYFSSKTFMLSAYDGDKLKGLNMYYVLEWIPEAKITTLDGIVDSSIALVLDELIKEYGYDQLTYNSNMGTIRMHDTQLDSYRSTKVPELIEYFIDALTHRANTVGSLDSKYVDYLVNLIENR